MVVQQDWHLGHCRKSRQGRVAAGTKLGEPLQGCVGSIGHHIIGRATLGGDKVRGIEHLPEILDVVVVLSGLREIVPGARQDHGRQHDRTEDR